MDFNEFKVYCDKGSCLRKTFISKTCKKESKKQKCFNKWQDQQNKPFNIDEHWEEVKIQVHERDKTCRIWNILTNEQKSYIFEVHDYDYNLLKNQLDCAHIESRLHKPELKYDLNNIILCSRYFHSLLDQYRHPVTQQSITKEERHEWFRKAKVG